MNKQITEYVMKHNNRKQENLKYDFMPDLLEIIERPTHVGGKVIIWSFFAFLIAGIIWAAISKVDVVVTAGGIVSPVGSVSGVQALENGTVTKICVSNGVHVQAGELLAVMDTDNSDIDVKSIGEEIEKLEKENELYRMMMEHKNLDDINLMEYDERIRTDMEYLIRQEQYFTETLENTENETYVTESKKKHELDILGNIVNNNDLLKELEISLEKAQKSMDSRYIKSLTAGYVADLADGLEGQVVSAGNRLMTVVPDNMEMEVQCYVANRDIADIHVGNPVVIKLNAYPYSEYGTLNGKITYISGTASSDEHMQNGYLVKVSIENMEERIELLTGMVAEIEIKIGKRSVLDYFLEPIMGTVHQSIKEK